MKLLNHISIKNLFFHLRNQNDGKKSEEPEEDESIWKMMKEMISLELLKDPRFLLVAISTFFQMLGFLVPFVFLINMATTSKGFEKADASFLVSIIGKIIFQ